MAKNAQQSASLQELIAQHQLVQGDSCPACAVNCIAPPCTNGPNRCACAVTHREAITSGATRLMPSIRESVPLRSRDLVLL
jgi:hypothetical protein